MKLFASWSGGKDCMLALHRASKNQSYEIAALVNMCNADNHYSRSHGLPDKWIHEQAENMNIPLVQKGTRVKEYEQNLKVVIDQLKEQGVEGGIFGDIYLQEHRDWIVRVCNDMGITPLFPLWHNNTVDLLLEFIESGFKSLVVSVRRDKLGKEWLGRTLNRQFLEDIKVAGNIDPCAENGEFHTFVFDGPLFAQPLEFQMNGSREDDKHWFLELT